MVSIIMPVYNASRFLRFALESVKAQTFRDWECICIDDGSTDASAQILDDAALSDARFMVKHVVNAGAGAARNLGIRFARFDDIFFLDADDTLEPETLATLVDAKEKHSADMVTCDYYFMDEQGRRQGKKTCSTYVSNNPFDDWLNERMYVFDVVWGKLLDKKLLRDKQFPCVQKHNEDVWVVADWMSRVKRVAVLPNQFVGYRQVTNSRSRNYTNKDYFDDAYLNALKFQETALSIGLDAWEAHQLHAHGGYGYFLYKLGKMMSESGLDGKNKYLIRKGVRYLRRLVKEKMIQYRFLSHRDQLLYLTCGYIPMPWLFMMLMRLRKGF